MRGTQFGEALTGEMLNELTHKHKRDVRDGLLVNPLIVFFESPRADPTRRFAQEARWRLGRR